MSTIAALLVAVALLGANGFFVAAEFALLAARRSRIQQLAAEGDRRAHHALAGLRELSLMLAGAQLGITMCSLGLGMIAEPAIARVLEGLLGELGLGLPSGVSHAVAFTVALSIVVFLHMVVGEMAPKSWAISHPESSALLLAPSFRLFAVVLRPVIRLLNMSANGVVRLVGVTPQAELALAHSAPDLMLLLEEAQREGAIEADQHELLARSLELSGRDAASAMTPRHQVVAVEAHAPVAELERTMVSTGRSRVVVFEGDLDHPVGFAHARDLLMLKSPRQAVTAGDVAQPLLVTGCDTALEELFLEMRGGRHLAVVRDPLGAVAGIITMEDVLEELVGEVEDETDHGSRRIRRLPGGVQVVEGSLRLDELHDRVGVSLPDGPWDTVAGFLIAQLGRVPVEGDRVLVGDVSLVVSSMDGVAVREVRVEPSPWTGPAT